MTAVDEPLELQGVAHLVRPTPYKASDLDQLRQAIEAAPDSSLFYHTVQFALRHRRITELPPDDLSGWVWGVVQDQETAERLWFASRTRNQSPEGLRATLLEVLDKIPPARRAQRDAPEQGQFTLLEADPVMIPTGMFVNDPNELARGLGDLDLSVWFYHLVQQPWFAGGHSQLSEWLRRRNAAKMDTWLQETVTSGLPLATARSRFLRRLRQSQLVRRVREAALETEDERRETARTALARLIRGRNAKPERP
jgi:hypothetical protein